MGGWSSRIYGDYVIIVQIIANNCQALVQVQVQVQAPVPTDLQVE